MNYRQHPNLINAREAFAPQVKKLEPKVDVVVSKIVGKKVFTRDPRLINLIVKWKKQKKGGEDMPDNFLEDPKKREELKKALNVSL